MTTSQDTPHTTAPAAIDQDQLTRAQKALLALTGDVAKQLAEDHGVCVRPLAMRRIDLTTGRVDVVPVPCGSTREDVCRPCSDKARRLRMAQCREGWHLEDEPIPAPAEPTDQQKQLMATRADLHAAYTRPAPTGTSKPARRSATPLKSWTPRSARSASGGGWPRSTPPPGL